MKQAFDELEVGQAIEGPRFAVTRVTIREFCEASLDYNPLHLDDEFMQSRFGKTEFGGVIMHGMTNFGLITRMLTDWLYPRGGIHRRLEARWLNPVRPGDSIQPHGVVTAKQATAKGRWVTLDIEVCNQRGEQVARGEAMAEFPVG
jgi:3-hydroxybutyryl-CoA dehydratase